MPLKKRFAILALCTAVAAWVGCGGAAGSSNNGGGGGGGGVPSSGQIKNIIVVVMQNGSFDHYFGMFAGVDGIRSGVPGFSQPDPAGNAVTPFKLTTTTPGDLPHAHQDFLADWNSGAMDGFARRGGAQAMGFYDGSTPGVDKLWSLAGQFALNDKFYASVMGDAPTNQLMMVAANDNDTPFSLQPFYGPCLNSVTASAPYTFQHVGDQLSAKGVSWAWFNENLNDCGVYVPQQNPFQFFTSTHGGPNIRDYTEFTAALTAGNVPAVSFIQPNPPHSTHPGSGDVTVGLNWLATFVSQVQASSIWNNAAIIVIWDSGGGWWDHSPPPQVDNQGLGVRVPMMVISPFAKKNFVSHTQMDDVSILRFIQSTFGLSSLNARNGISADMSDMFSF